MARTKESTAEAELTKLYNMGLKCKLHGMPVSEMNKKELIAFIGFLDELATDRMMELRGLENQCKKS